MKKIILIACLSISFFSYSQKLLKDSQKDLLFNDAGFRQEVKWGLLNKASYWKTQDGTAVPGGQTAANLKRWALSRVLAAQLTNSPAIAENELNIKQFLVFVKNTAVWQ